MVSRLAFSLELPLPLSLSLSNTSDSGDPCVVLVVLMCSGIAFALQPLCHNGKRGSNLPIMVSFRHDGSIIHAALAYTYVPKLYHMIPSRFSIGAIVA